MCLILPTLHRNSGENKNRGNTPPYTEHEGNEEQTKKKKKEDEGKEGNKMRKQKKIRGRHESHSPSPPFLPSA